MNKLASWCRARARIVFTSLSLVTLSPLAAQAAPVVLEAPVAAPLTKDMGTGLCVTSAISPIVSAFDLNKVTFNNGINQFIDTATTGPQKLPPDQDKPYGKNTSVMRSIFDLSNNNTLFTTKLSYGDFLQENGQCQGIGGCGFFLNDSDTHFASRFRGFLNVTGPLVGKSLHIGFYADDAVSLTLYDKNLAPHEVITREPVLGSVTWRLTNTVTFKTPGLYPLEILYVEMDEHAALEMAYLIDASFVDVELPVTQIGSPNLKDAGFTLFKQTDFYETRSGAAPFANLNQCAQCQRQFVNQPGNNGCDAGYHCNEAALCAPCDSDSFCGASCSPCGGATPTCINVNGTPQCGSLPGGSSSAASSSSSAASGSSSGSSTGSGGGGGGGDTDPGGGCGCGVRGAPAAGGLWLGLGLILLARRRR
jgi:outer membrane exchange protein TraA